MRYILTLLIVASLFIALLVQAAEPGIACSCVRTAISYGLKIPQIDAKDLALLLNKTRERKLHTPTIGGGIIFYYPKNNTYHVALIQKFLADGFYVIEGNYRPCIIAPRLVDYNDKYIIGFINF